MKISGELIEKSRSLINEAGPIVITNHLNPDGDAMGSALGLKAILALAGKKADVIVPNAYPHFLKWMQGSDEVGVFENNKVEATDLLNKADLIFHLDYNSLKRSGPMEEALRQAKAARIVIDHHQQPEDFAEVLISDTSMSSTCEMVYHFITGMDLEKHLTLAAAECLYTGIITDTGNFRFSATTPETHKVAASLLQLGVKPHEIAARVYDNNSINRLGLLSRTLDRMEILPEFHTVIMSLTANDLKDYEYQKGDTEGFVNYGLSVRDVVLSVFLSEKDDLVKMSFRSKGNFDVNVLARAHFNGGGHMNAAGAVSELSMDATIEKLKKALAQYADELQNAN